MNRFFQDSFIHTHWVEGEFGMSSWNPVVDIYDDNDKLLIKAELSGLD
jgi:hypothetical protein